MRKTWWMAGGVLLLVGSSLAPGQDKTDKYLTKDGKLAHALVVRDLQSGFAGVTGRQWVVEPSGAWDLGSVLKGKVKEENTGKLRAEAVKALAAALAKYDLDSLVSK